MNSPLGVNVLSRNKLQQVAQDLCCETRREEAAYREYANDEQHRSAARGPPIYEVLLQDSTLMYFPVTGVADNDVPRRCVH